MNLNRNVPVGKRHVTACTNSSSSSSIDPSAEPPSYRSPKTSDFDRRVRLSVCVHPPATSPAIITSRPPPLHANVT
eukprot:31412-Pelagococcus_subviridis.AAC.7